MFIILWLLTQDSIPPLPDPGLIKFPEPSLWLEPMTEQIRVNGYAGQFYGGNINFNHQRFNLNGEFKKEEVWYNTTKLWVESSYSLPLPGIWLMPSVKGLYLRNSNKYRFLNPGLEIAATPSWAIIYALFTGDYWRLNEKEYAENRGGLKIIFDRTKYLPHLQIVGSTADRNLSTEVLVGVNIESLQLSYGSTLPLFSGPFFRLSLQKPVFQLEAEVRSGRTITYLKDHFLPETPLQYPTPMPEESLRLALDLKFGFRLKKHTFTITTAYNNFVQKLIPDTDFILTPFSDIQTSRIAFITENLLQLKNLEIAHRLNACYFWSDCSVPFQPKYSVYDSLVIKYGIIELLNISDYIFQRPGISTTLPEILLVSMEIGLRLEPIRLYTRIFNLFDQRRELFDNYTISERQYGLGLEFQQQF